jgi:transcriptional regulator with XRE-family HTH domain
MADKELPQDIGTFIRDLRQTAKISLRQLADKAGVSNPYLSQIERGLRKPSAEVLQQIASALRVLAATAADPELTIAQKQSLSQIYETFRNESKRHSGEEHGGTPADAPDAAPDVSEEDALLEQIARVEAGAAPAPTTTTATEETK